MPALGRGGGNAEQPLVQEESNILGALLGQGLGNPVCTHTLKARLAAWRAQVHREMGQKTFILLKSSAQTRLLQLVLWSGTFSGTAVQTALFSASRNSQGTEEVLREGKVWSWLSFPAAAESGSWERVYGWDSSAIYSLRYHRLCLSS